MSRANGRCVVAAVVAVRCGAVPPPDTLCVLLFLNLARSVLGPSGALLPVHDAANQPGPWRGLPGGWGLCLGLGRVLRGVGSLNECRPTACPAPALPRPAARLHLS